MDLINDNLKLIVLDNCKELGNKINEHINNIRNTNDNYIIKLETPRFSNGEGKAKLLESIRGKDAYIISDTNNCECTYTMRGYENHMSPDDHFQDIKRVIGAIMGHADSVTVIMPLLYGSRQHKRNGRESLDCALALQELEHLGVKEILTFDAHDPRVQNAIPNLPFDNIFPSNMVISEFIDNENIDFRKFITIAPDNGAMERARYFADMLRCKTGAFVKRRDYSKVVNGSNPITGHDYLGEDLNGLNAFVIDDMIASGKSMISTAQDLKERGANKVYIYATFALFDKGIEIFDEAYEKGIFDKLYTTNLTNIKEDYRNREWIKVVDCSRLIAKHIYTLNNKQSISELANGKQKILKKLENKTSNY